MNMATSLIFAGAGLIGSVGYEFRGKSENGRSAPVVLERGLGEVVILIAALFVEFTVSSISIFVNIIGLLITTTSKFYFV